MSRNGTINSSGEIEFDDYEYNYESEDECKLTKDDISILVFGLHCLVDSKVNKINHELSKEFRCNDSLVEQLRKSMDDVDVVFKKLYTIQQKLTEGL